jgi:hypothetical protein
MDEHHRKEVVMRFVVVVMLVALVVGGDVAAQEDKYRLHVPSAEEYLETLQEVTRQFYRVALPLCAIMDETTSPSKNSIELKGGEQGQTACQEIEKPIQKYSRKQSVVVLLLNTNGGSCRKLNSVGTGS